MKITALVENHSSGKLKAKHGLSLFIETTKHNILFDLGPDNTLFDNAKAMNIDLSQIDTVVISHGHMDHGGALEHFLKLNTTAKVYLKRTAFERHYSKFLFFKFNVGIDEKIARHPQIVLLDNTTVIDDELTVFTVEDMAKYYSSANNSLYTDNGKEDFSHEQHLIINDIKTMLIVGCSHAGIVNILEKASPYHPQLCIGGYHLYNPLTKKTEDDILLDKISNELRKYDIQFYTCHCTGLSAFQYMSKKLPQLSYLSCGETISV